MTKYIQEVKDKCVAAAKAGQHLKSIQLEFGPNPKATLRYLKKAGVDYTAILAQLKKDGKSPQTPVAVSKDKAKARIAAKKEAGKPVEKIIEE